MSIYKRGKTYWFKFSFDGKLYRRSSKVKNLRQAENIEAAFRTQLAKGEVGIEDQKAAPTLAEFELRFVDYVKTRHSNKPETVLFYTNRLKRLLSWKAMSEARLDRVDESLIERYVVHRRSLVSITSVNRELATLRRILHVAHDWKLIRVVPKVRLLTGERQRDFVSDHETEQRYLAAAPEPLRSVGVVLLHTALRLGEALALRWADVHLEPAGSARYGWVQVRDGKSRNARRTVPLAARVGLLLAAKQREASSDWVFPGEAADRPLLGTSLAHTCRPGAGKKRRYPFPKDFVLHSMRHTCLTRLGEAGTDAFTIMKLAGHSSVTVSQRYVHPTPEAVERAFDRLEDLNMKAFNASGGSH